MENQRLLLCDGVKRTTNKPKRKNLIHLQFTRYYLSEVREKLLKGEKLSDLEIREGLNRIKEGEVYK